MKYGKRSLKLYCSSFKTIFLVHSHAHTIPFSYSEICGNKLLHVVGYILQRSPAILCK